jgi:hypothetical protein
MTRDQLRALWLHRAIAAKVAADPARVLAQAKSTANSLLDREPDGAPWLRQWLALLDRGPEAVMRTLVSTDPLARELRANSPFAGVLSTSERETILTSFSEATSSRRCSKPSGIEAAWRRPWAWALALAVLYAASDELHQGFVAGRHAAAVDVGIGAAGEGDFSAGHPGAALAGLPPGSASGPDRRPGAPPGAHTLQ